MSVTSYQVRSRKVPKVKGVDYHNSSLGQGQDRIAIEKRDMGHRQVLLTLSFQISYTYIHTCVNKFVPTYNLITGALGLLEQCARFCPSVVEKKIEEYSTSPQVS